jgi:hypothetical protein
LRITGTRVDALLGRDRKGVCYTELWRPADRRSVAAGLAAVIEGASPLVAGARLRARGDACVELELLLLPLRHFGRPHARVLGALTPLYPVDWLGLASPAPLEMISMRTVDKTAPRPAAPSTPRMPPLLIVHRGGKT